MTAHATFTAASAPDVLASDDFGNEAETGDDALTANATFVTFDLGGQVFAADVSDVREILDMQPISALPNATGDLLGMIDVRGEGLAVMDIAGRLGMNGKPDAQDSRIIVLDLGLDGGRALGIVADRVRNVVEIAADRIDAAPKVPGGWDSSSLIGVTRIEGRLVYLLSLRDTLQSNLPGPFDFA